MDESCKNNVMKWRQGGGANQMYLCSTLKPWKQLRVLYKLHRWKHTEETVKTITAGREMQKQTHEKANNDDNEN